jgi:D-serine deaminase-like pyridoxal phosphate-dependent protein
MKLSDLPTPCLVLDRTILRRNLARMGEAVARHGVALRPHMKTAKSYDVARLALAVPPAAGGITVSTLAEAEYFLAHGITDILYAVAITPRKLDTASRLAAGGASLTLITDDPETAGAIAAYPGGMRALIEIDCGEARGGIAPDDPALLEIAGRLGPRLAGVLTHAGHSYVGRSPADMAGIAEAERLAAVTAAGRLRDAGFACPVVSVGSSPTALHAATLAGATETRPGVYMFGDLFQAEIGTVAPESIALTVLASVIGRRLAENRIVVDAGAIALSKDRSTEATAHDCGFGLMLDMRGRRGYGRSIVARANQEHGVIALDPAVSASGFKVGDLVRIAPNHACLAAAAHDRYFVVDGDEAVAEIWPRVNGW